MTQTEVLIVLGSAADEKYLTRCAETLKKLEISFTVKVASAHRSPDRVLEILKTYHSAKVILAFAGHAAHLAGVIAAHALVPVVAIPLPSSDLKGMDSLLSCVQMPAGVPVATMAIGDAGAQNAACFAAQILSLHTPALADKWRAYKSELSVKVEQSSHDVEKKWQG